jgi:cytochrome c oxidase subunit 2
MAARDVIHSFWVPNLSGEKDLIPGKTTETWIQADAPGVYRGQCAEFCGHQHAKMAMEVVAESPEAFEQWAAHMREPAATPSDSMRQAGRQVFVASSCSNCHAVGGSPASGHVGPDLTHLASRHTIAAATLPNTRGNLAGWILDPQQIKPGAMMPPNSLDPDQLQSLLAYLEGLK